MLDNFNSNPNPSGGNQNRGGEISNIGKIVLIGTGIKVLADKTGVTGLFLNSQKEKSEDTKNKNIKSVNYEVKNKEKQPKDKFNFYNHEKLLQYYENKLKVKQDNTLRDEL